MDEIIQHIIDYMFTEKDSFALVMNGVNVNGVLKDNVHIFGEEAVTHMADVKTAFAYVKDFSLIGLAVVAVCVFYIILRKKHTSSILLKNLLKCYGFFIGIALLFCGISFWQTQTSGLNFTNQVWRNLHYIFFSMQADKIEGSFFADALTNILTMDFFLGAIQTVLITMASVFAFSFIVAVIAKIKSALSYRNNE